MAVLACLVLSTLCGSSMMTTGLHALTSSRGLNPPVSLSLGRWKRLPSLAVPSFSRPLLKASMLMTMTWMELDVAKLPTGPMSFESYTK